jgi:hypothetical protein
VSKPYLQVRPTALCWCEIMRTEKIDRLPLPMIHNLIRLEQYSLFHHSNKRLRVSRPTKPPSSSKSLFLDTAEGAGEALREGTGEPLILLPFDGKTSPRPSNFICALRLLAALYKLSLFPLPNFLHGCPSLLRCLFSWKMRHMSDCKFFLCSEWTAFISRVVQDDEKMGE